MTRMRTSDDINSSERNKEDKEGGGNLGSLSSRSELERTDQPNLRQDTRSMAEKLDQKAQVNRKQADEIANPKIDSKGNPETMPR